MEACSRETLFAFESPDDSPGFLLWQVSNLWRRKIKAALDPLGLTHVQVVLLVGVAWLGHDDDALTQVKLAAHAKTDVMMISKVLRTLESKGLIRRDAHPVDTRANVLATTAAGEVLLSRAVKLVEAVDHEFFGVLGAQKDAFNSSLLSLRTADTPH
jgi:DNA-binding MarR family transcriptional regulator